MSEITLPHNWRPRPYQVGLWNYLRGGGKRAVACYHRRAGKDEVFLHHMACAAHERVGNYWYMLPEYSQARKSMWDAINPHTGVRRIDEVFPQEIRKVREHEMMLTFDCGSTIQLVGSDNFNALVGSPPVGLVFSEYALANPAAWAYLRPILLENGGWAAFNSTPRGHNHFEALCKHAASDKDWFFESLTAEQTGVFTRAELMSELKELQAQHGDDYGLSLWRQEYFVSFDAAIMGAIWADCVAKAESEGRLTELEPDLAAPVHTAWDLGFTDDTAIWFFQMIAGGIHVIDSYEANGKDVAHYADILKKKAKAGGYSFGTHFLPHDARPRTFAAGGKSILHQLRDTGIGRCVIAPRLDLQEGIQAARATFPHCRFDTVKCAKGLEALKNYHREWDDEKKAFSMRPAHDWSSHYADAWRYLSLVWRHPKSLTAETAQYLEPGTFVSGGSAHGANFGAMKNAHLSKMKTKREMRMH